MTRLSAAYISIAIMSIIVSLYLLVTKHAPIVGWAFVREHWLVYTGFTLLGAVVISLFWLIGSVIITAIWPRLSGEDP